MPENDKKLTLHSPAGSEHATYRWPLIRSETWDEALEIVETIRWVCQDFPDLKLAVENYVLNDFDSSSYDSMKQLCERYNRAVDNIRKLWSGRQPPDCIDAPPSLPLLKHILNQVYNRAVTNPDALNSYEPFSPEVYGETSFELVSEVIKHTRLTENDVFLDLGSGIGQVVLQAAAATGCKCYGIEKAEIPAQYSEKMEREFIKWMEWYGKSYGEFEISKGDFLDPEFTDILNSATVIFVNNFAFGPKLNHELKLKFSNLMDGTKIVSSHEFCPLNFRVTTRNLSDIGSMMHVDELSPLKGHVSWTGKPVTYYLHVIDRGKLEKFFRRQKHPEEIDSEDSSRTASPCSEIGEARHEREGEIKEERVSENSEGSSLDSSDNDFAEQIRKIKTNQHHHQQHFNQKKQHLERVPSDQTPPPFHSSPALQTAMSYTGSTKDIHTPTPLHHAQGENTSHKPARKQHAIPMGQGQRSSSAGRVHSRKINRAGNKKRSNLSGASSSGALLGQMGGAKLCGPNTGPMDTLFASIQDQLSSYVEQLGSSDHQGWMKEAIEKEKLKQSHLQVVIQHLESEVSNLSKETIGQMEKSMVNLGITRLTPAGLLVGAKAIVNHNKHLRIEMKELERELDSIRGQNEFMELLCKEQHVSVPKIQEKNRSLPLSLSNGEARVPPLPNEFMETDFVATSTPLPYTNPPPSRKRRWSPGRGGNSGGGGGNLGSIHHSKKKQVERNSFEKALGVLQKPPDIICQKVMVADSVRAGMSKELEEQLKVCEIDLERIDQELLELGPFAKDALPPVPGTTVGVGVRPLTSPPDMLVGGGGPPPQPSRRQRKGNRHINTGNKDVGVSKRKSEDGSATPSPMSISGVSLGEDKAQYSSEKYVGKEKERAKDPHPKSKWRKVGSAGSPSVPPTTQIPLSKRPLSNHSSNNTEPPPSLPISDSRAPPTLTPPQQQQPVSKATKKKPRPAKGGVDPDIDSPSMIPAASEIEMLSLYIPNTHWETIEPSPPQPQQPDHDPTELNKSVSQPPPVSTSSSPLTKLEDRNIASEVLNRTGTSLSQQRVPSINSESTVSNDRLIEVVDPTLGSTPVSTNSENHRSTLIPHHHEQAVYAKPSTRVCDHDVHNRTTTSGGSELRRHIVVRDGAPIEASKPNFSVAHLTNVADSHHTTTSPPFPRSFRDNRSSTPVERTSPSSHSNLNAQRWRRNSSNSSLKSMTQHSFEEGNSTRKSATPPHQRVSTPPHQRVSGAPSQLQQQQVSHGGGEVKPPVSRLVNPGMMHWSPTANNSAQQFISQPNLLTSQSSAAGGGGLSCYPFTNPFLPGSSWLSTGGVLTAGLPQLHPSVFPMDPNTPFKQVFNPGLLPYRYPFSVVTQALKTVGSQSAITGLSGGAGNPPQMVTSNPQAGSQGVMYPLAAANANLSAFHSVSDGVSGSMTQGQHPIMSVPPGLTAAQVQAFPGMVLSSGAAPKEDNGEQHSTQPPQQGMNWPAALVGGSGFNMNMMPYLMGQAQLGMSAPGLGVTPGGHLYNSPHHLSGASLGGGTGSEGNLTKVGVPVDLVSFSRKSSQHKRRGSSASNDSVHRPGEISPSSTPPLAVPGGKKSQYSLMPPDGGGNWKTINEQVVSPQIMIPPPYSRLPQQNPTAVTSSPYSPTVPTHMITNPNHMMPMGYSPSVGGASGGGSNSPKGRGGGESAISRTNSDKMKIRIHHVRNDDFKMQVKPDRRRKRWRGKDKDVIFSARAELADSAVRRLVTLNQQVDPSLLPALPPSLGVEPGIKAVQPPSVDETVKEIKLPPAGGGDGNYGLNMLADMSTIHTTKAEQISEGAGTRGSGGGGGTEQFRSSDRLAASSLLSLGEDLDIRDKDSENDRSQNLVTQVENTAATSLLQLSGVVLPKAGTAAPSPHGPPLEEGSNPEREAGALKSSAYDVQGRSTRSASFSAAEAMIMMGTDSETKTNDVFENTQQDIPLNSEITTVAPAVVLHNPQEELWAEEEEVEEDRHPMRTRGPRKLTIDSEMTDTDSEITLSPESPGDRRGKFSSLMPMDDEDDDVEKVSSSEGLLLASNNARFKGQMARNGLSEDHLSDGVFNGGVKGVTDKSISQRPPLMVEEDLRPQTMLGNVVALLESPIPIRQLGDTDVKADEGAMAGNAPSPPLTEQTSPLTQPISPPVTDPILSLSAGPMSPVPHPPLTSDPVSPLPTESTSPVSQPLTNPTSSLIDSTSPRCIDPTSPSPPLQSALSHSPTGSSGSGCGTDNEVLLSSAERPKFISTFGPAPSDTESHTMLSVDEATTTTSATEEVIESGQSSMKEEEMIQDNHQIELSPNHQESSLPNITEETPELDKDPNISDLNEIADVPNCTSETEETRTDNLVESPYSHSPGEKDCIRPASPDGLAEVLESSNADIYSTETPPLTIPSPTTDANLSSPGSSPKIKASKIKKNSSKSVVSKSKNKSSHGKVRIIKIKRAKSPKHSPAVSLTGDLSTPSLTSWNDFADAVVSNDGEDSDFSSDSRPIKHTEPQQLEGSGVGVESGPTLENISVETTSAIQEHSKQDEITENSELTKTTEARSNSDCKDNQDLSRDNVRIAPQNILKIATLDRHHHHHHKHAPSSFLTRNAKDGRSEDRISSKKGTKPPTATSSLHDKELFDVDPLAHSSLKREKDGGGVTKPRKIKIASSNKSLSHHGEVTSAGLSDARGKTKHLHPGSKPLSDGDESSMYNRFRKNDLHLKCRDAGRGHSHDRSIPGKVQYQGKQPSSPAHSGHRSPHTNKEQRDLEFYPLSDDDSEKSARYTSKDFRSNNAVSSKWPAEEEEQQWKHKNHRRNHDDSIIPSPSSSSSSSSKKHHHRHHERSIGYGNEDPCRNKQEWRNEKSTSRGSSPDRKRHHHHHHHHHHQNHPPDETQPFQSHYVTPSAVKTEVRKRSYESISEDDMFDISGAQAEEEMDGMRDKWGGIHDGGQKRAHCGVGVKRSHVSSGDSDEVSLPASTESGNTVLHSNHGLKRKKDKHSKENKERWKEGNIKRKHGKQHS